MIGIYKITSPSNRVYIGQSVDIKSRWESYKCKNCKNQPKLYRSLNKYGVDKHKFEVIHSCEIEELNELERYYQEFYDCIGKNGLNCILTKSKLAPRVVSEETKRKVSEKMKGRKLTQEHIDKIQEGKIRNGSNKHTEEFIRLQVTRRSNNVILIKNNHVIVFECVRDCAEYFNCTTKNILFRNRRRKQGITPTSGMFKDYYLEILD